MTGLANLALGSAPVAGGFLLAVATGQLRFDGQMPNLASLGRFALRRGDRKVRGRCGCERGWRWSSVKAAEGSCWRVFRSTPVALCCL